MIKINSPSINQGKVFFFKFGKWNFVFLRLKKRQTIYSTELIEIQQMITVLIC